MGNCFSRRKRGGVAAVTHNTSPRSSFSFSCKGDATMDAAILTSHKPVNELVVVVTKDSAPLLANKSSSMEGRHLQRQHNANLLANLKEGPSQYTEESGSLSSPGKLEEKALQVCHIPSLLGSAYKDEKLALQGHEDSTIQKPLLGSVGDSAHVEDVHVLPQSHVGQGGHKYDDTDYRNDQVEEPSTPFGSEFTIEGAEINPCLGKLKRSRSCEESVRSDAMQPPRRRSFQESTRFSPQASQLETIPESQFGTTKYLEGLDLVDALPLRSSRCEIPSCVVNGEHQNDSNCLSIEFFNLKNRYLSSCSLASQPDRSVKSPSRAISCNVGDSAQDAMTTSFALMHSRASSLDSSEEMGMESLFPSARHPIPAVAEENEEDCHSDGSETFEFRQAIAARMHAPNQMTSRQENPVKGEFVYEGDAEGSFKELSVVATGDAVLYASSKSDDFDLIPSKSYVRGSPKQESTPSSALAASYSTSFQRRFDADKHLSVDEIISLLENDELDEDVLLSFLNLATASHGGNTASCHASDVASEASFEFKVKSSGSTPHSTPSTPMLSAGSTPKRITQLSPLALTPEEIAEIWGVFEQRQFIATAPM